VLIWWAFVGAEWRPVGSRSVGQVAHPILTDRRARHAGQNDDQSMTGLSEDHAALPANPATEGPDSGGSRPARTVKGRLLGFGRTGETR